MVDRKLVRNSRICRYRMSSVPRYVIHLYRRSGKSWTVQATGHDDIFEARQAASWMVKLADGAAIFEVADDGERRVVVRYGDLPPDRLL